MNWDWSFVFDKVLPAMIPALGVTINVTVQSFVLAAVLGLPLMLLRTSRSKTVATIFTELIEFVRGTPLLVQIFFLFYVLPDFGIKLPPLLTGIVAIGLYNATLCSEVYRAGFAAVPRGQWEAATALNLSSYRTMRDVIIPQSLPPIVPALGNYLIIIFKETPLLSFVSIPELMHVSKEIGVETYRFTEAVTIAGLLYLVLSLVSAIFIRLVEGYLNRRIYR